MVVIVPHPLVPTTKSTLHENFTKNIYEDHAIRDVDSIIEGQISTYIKPPSSYLTSEMTLVFLMHVYE